jgi:hypothetical protein
MLAYVPQIVSTIPADVRTSQHHRDKKCSSMVNTTFTACVCLLPVHINRLLDENEKLKLMESADDAGFGIAEGIDAALANEEREEELQKLQRDVKKLKFLEDRQTACEATAPPMLLCLFHSPPLPL